MDVNSSINALMGPPYFDTIVMTSKSLLSNQVHTSFMELHLVELENLSYNLALRMMHHHIAK
jgi:hypothetical protein